MENRSTETSHNYDDDFIILHALNKGAKLNAFEALKINKQKWKGNLLNEKLDLNNNSSLLQPW